MRFRWLLPILAGLLVPAAALAQSAPPAASGKPQGITRDDYIHRAEERAARRFDRMDTDHDGILTPDEIQAWRQSHPRKPKPPPQ